MNIPMTHFSWLTIFLLFCGWATHWLMSVRKAKAASIAAGTSIPTWRSYWTADPEATILSVIGVVVFYFILPWLAATWPALSVVIGTTPENPMNPMAAYLGGIASPYLADWAGKRVAKMVGD